jgi:hypothetical protein
VDDGIERYAGRETREKTWYMADYHHPTKVAASLGAWKSSALFAVASGVRYQQIGSTYKSSIYE